MDYVKMKNKDTLNRDLFSSTSRVEDFDGHFCISQRLIVGDKVIEKKDSLDKTELKHANFPMDHIEALLMNQKEELMKFFKDKMA